MPALTACREILLVSQCFVELSQLNMLSVFSCQNLGNMSLSADAIVKRDEIVFRSCLNNQKPIPIAMVLSGGYQKSNAPTVSKSILNLHAKFGLT